MPDYALYRLNLTTLTPLHIGSGVTLLHEYDYAIAGGRTWRIDDAAFLDAQNTDDPAFIQQLAVTPPARLLREADFTPGSPFFRYVIKGTPRSQAEGAQVQEQIKDAFDRPYLPGASLKGALRTLLGWQVWQNLNLKPEMRLLGRNPRRAAQEYEHQIFGETPNTDLLRALQVSDSRPAAAERLMVLNARVLGRGGALASPIELEAIRAETVFELDLKLDLALFSDWAKRQRLRLNHEDALMQLPAIANTRALQRARREAQWFGAIPTATRVRDFYQQLASIRPEPNQFVLQVGWGTGWEDKTFGDQLSQDQRFMAQAIQEFRLSRGRGQSGGPFPSSRRVAVAYRKDARENVVETPAYPLGWVLVTFEPVKGPAAWKSSVPQPQAGQAAAASAPTTAPHVAAQQPPARPASAAQPREMPAETPARPQPVERSALLRSFEAPPRAGQRFVGVVLDPGPRPAYLELPGLSSDEWMGVLNDAGRKLREGEKVICQVVAVQPDPHSKGSWLVDCQLVER